MSSLKEEKKREEERRQEKSNGMRRHLGTYLKMDMVGLFMIEPRVEQGSKVS
jgi:hypothetical protein